MKNKFNGNHFPILDINGDENSEFSRLVFVLFHSICDVSIASVNDHLWIFIVFFCAIRSAHARTHICICAQSFDAILAGQLAQHMPNTYLNTFCSLKHLHNITYV